MDLKDITARSNTVMTMGIMNKLENFIINKEVLLAEKKKLEESTNELSKDMPKKLRVLEYVLKEEFNTNQWYLKFQALEDLVNFELFKKTENIQNVYKNQLPYLEKINQLCGTIMNFLHTHTRSIIKERKRNNKSLLIKILSDFEKKLMPEIRRVLQFNSFLNLLHESSKYSLKVSEYKRIEDSKNNKKDILTKLKEIKSDLKKIFDFLESNYDNMITINSTEEFSNKIAALKQKFSDELKTIMTPRSSAKSQDAKLRSLDYINNNLQLTVKAFEAHLEYLRSEKDLTAFNQNYFSFKSKCYEQLFLLDIVSKVQLTTRERTELLNYLKNSSQAIMISKNKLIAIVENYAAKFPNIYQIFNGIKQGIIYITDHIQLKNDKYKEEAIEMILDLEYIRSTTDNIESLNIIKKLLSQFSLMNVGNDYLFYGDLLDKAISLYNNVSYDASRKSIPLSILEGYKLFNKGYIDGLQDQFHVKKNEIHTIFNYSIKKYINIIKKNDLEQKLDCVMSWIEKRHQVMSKLPIIDLKKNTKKDFSDNLLCLLDCEMKEVYNQICGIDTILERDFEDVDKINKEIISQKVKNLKKLYNKTLRTLENINALIKDVPSVTLVEIKKKEFNQKLEDLVQFIKSIHINDNKMNSIHKDVAQDIMRNIFDEMKRDYEDITKCINSIPESKEKDTLLEQNKSLETHFETTKISLLNEYQEISKKEYYDFDDKYSLIEEHYKHIEDLLENRFDGTDISVSKMFLKYIKQIRALTKKYNTEVVNIINKLETGPQSEDSKNKIDKLNILAEKHKKIYDLYEEKLDIISNIHDIQLWIEEYGVYNEYIDRIIKYCEDCKANNQDISETKKKELNILIDFFKEKALELVITGKKIKPIISKSKKSFESAQNESEVGIMNEIFYQSLSQSPIKSILYNDKNIAVMINDGNNLKKDLTSSLDLLYFKDFIYADSLEKFEDDLRNIEKNVKKLTTIQSNLPIQSEIEESSVLERTNIYQIRSRIVILLVNINYLKNNLDNISVCNLAHEYDLCLEEMELIESQYDNVIKTNPFGGNNATKAEMEQLKKSLADFKQVYFCKGTKTISKRDLYLINEKFERRILDLKMIQDDIYELGISEANINKVRRMKNGIYCFENLIDRYSKCDVEPKNPTQKADVEEFKSKLKEYSAEVNKTDKIIDVIEIYKNVKSYQKYIMIKEETMKDFYSIEKISKNEILGNPSVVRGIERAFYEDELDKTLNIIQTFDYSPLSATASKDIKGKLDELYKYFTEYKIKIAQQMHELNNIYHQQCLQEHINAYTNNIKIRNSEVFFPTKLQKIEEVQKETIVFTIETFDKFIEKINEYGESIQKYASENHQTNVFKEKIENCVKLTKDFKSNFDISSVPSKNFTATHLVFQIKDHIALVDINQEISLKIWDVNYQQFNEDLKKVNLWNQKGKELQNFDHKLLVDLNDKVKEASSFYQKTQPIYQAYAKIYEGFQIIMMNEYIIDEASFFLIKHKIFSLIKKFLESIDEQTRAVQAKNEMVFQDMKQYESSKFYSEVEKLYTMSTAKANRTTNIYNQIRQDNEKIRESSISYEQEDSKLSDSNKAEANELEKQQGNEESKEKALKEQVDTKEAGNEEFTIKIQPEVVEKKSDKKTGTSLIKKQPIEQNLGQDKSFVMFEQDEGENIIKVINLIKESKKLQHILEKSNETNYSNLEEEVDRFKKSCAKMSSDSLELTRNNSKWDQSAYFLNVMNKRAQKIEQVLEKKKAKTDSALLIETHEKLFKTAYQDLTNLSMNFDEEVLNCGNLTEEIIRSYTTKFNELSKTSILKFTEFHAKNISLIKQNTQAHEERNEMLKTLIATLKDALGITKKSSGTVIEHPKTNDEEMKEIMSDLKEFVACLELFTKYLYGKININNLEKLVNVLNRSVMDLTLKTFGLKDKLAVDTKYYLINEVIIESIVKSMIDYLNDTIQIIYENRNIGKFKSLSEKVQKAYQFYSNPALTNYDEKSFKEMESTMDFISRNLFPTCEFLFKLGLTELHLSIIQQDLYSTLKKYFYCQSGVFFRKSFMNHVRSLTNKYPTFTENINLLWELISKLPLYAPIEFDPEVLTQKATKLTQKQKENLHKWISKCLSNREYINDFYSIFYIFLTELLEITPYNRVFNRTITKLQEKSNNPKIGIETFSEVLPFEDSFKLVNIIRKVSYDLYFEPYFKKAFRSI